MNYQTKGRKTMAVKIRLTRLGDKKSPFYRVVVTDSRKARDGEYIEKLGTFNPLTDPAEIVLDEEKTKKWLANGAQPTETAKTILVRQGLMQPEKARAPKTDTKKKK